MDLLSKTWDIFLYMFNAFFDAAAPYLPIFYTVAGIYGAFSMFRRWRP